MIHSAFVLVLTLQLIPYTWLVLLTLFGSNFLTALQAYYRRAAAAVVLYTPASQLSC